MNVCVPVLEDQGLMSRPSPHFGSSPFFALVDTVTMNPRTIRNQDEVHQHGMCNPLGAIQGEGVDVVIVGGIGGGALRKLQAVGIPVLWAQGLTLGEIIAQFKAGALQEMNPAATCGHGHGSGDRASEAEAHGHGSTCCHG